MADQPEPTTSDRITTILKDDETARAALNAAARLKQAATHQAHARETRMAAASR